MPVPKRQIADSLAEAIRSGRYAPGGALPSYKALAEEYGVALGTVQAAMADLRDRGLVITRHGAGSIVRPDLDLTDLSNPVAHSSLEQELREVKAMVVEILELLKSRG